MKLNDIVSALELKVITGGGAMEQEITGAYVSDLLSDVLGNSQKGQLWITLQTHINIVAVAVMKEIPGIVFIGGKLPDKQIINKAESEGIVLLASPLANFELTGRLYQLLNQSGGLPQ